jgi:FkbM family methyltransferase
MTENRLASISSESPDAPARRVSLRDRLRPYAVTGRSLLRRDLRLSDIGYARSVSYSQFGEDLWLADYFGDRNRGFYVDVGAFDPFNASNTLLFYRRGWFGINIEPVPAAFARLHHFRRRDINIGVAIDESAGQASFIVDGPFSGLDAEGHLWRSRERPRIVVPTLPLASVLQEHCLTAEIDFLDVDCEGRELQVLRSNDWERFRPQIVLLEVHPDAPDDAAAFLAARGYQQLVRLQLTRLFERE